MSESVIPIDDDIVGQDLILYTPSKIRISQRDNPFLKFWIYAVWNRKRPKFDEILQKSNHIATSRTYDKLKIQRDILYREVTIDEETH